LILVLLSVGQVDFIYLTCLEEGRGKRKKKKRKEKNFMLVKGKESGKNGVEGGVPKET